MTVPLVQKPTLSIVVTSYTMRRFDDICRLLESIEGQTRNGIEVIFVSDNNQNLADALQSHARRREFKNLFLKIIVNSSDVGVNACRNLGIRSSNGDIVGVVDDDVVLFPEWVERTLADFADDGDLIGLTGPAIPLWQSPKVMSWFPKELDFIWGCTVWNWSEAREIRNVGGMNCSFRRDALMNVGLYDTRIGPKGGEERIGWFFPSGEEVDLSLRLRLAFPRGRTVFDPGIKILHKAESSRFNLHFVIKRSFRFGYTKRYIELKFQSAFHDDLLQLEKSHLRDLVFSASAKFFHSFRVEPRVALRRIIVVFLGSFFAGIGYLCYSLKPFVASD